MLETPAQKQQVTLMKGSSERLRLESPVPQIENAPLSSSLKKSSGDRENGCLRSCLEDAAVPSSMSSDVDAGSIRSSRSNKYLCTVRKEKLDQILQNNDHC